MAKSSKKHQRIARLKSGQNGQTALIGDLQQRFKQHTCFLGHPAEVYSLQDILFKKLKTSKRKKIEHWKIIA